MVRNDASRVSFGTAPINSNPLVGAFPFAPDWSCTTGFADVDELIACHVVSLHVVETLDDHALNLNQGQADPKRLHIDDHTFDDPVTLGNAELFVEAVG